MSPEQVGAVLGAAALRDNRTVGPADIMAWLQDIGDLDPADALAAVSRHYRESTDRLMPAHVRRLAAEIDRERRRAEREAEDAAERLAIGGKPRADPARVHALLDELRRQFGPGDPDALRRPEVLEWERARERAARAEPNPHYDPNAQPVLPDTGGEQ